MKNKVYIIGPKSSGKTTFVHKMMSRDFLMLKGNVVESTDVPDNLDDAIQVYLIFPGKEDLKARGGAFSQEDEDKYMEFYHRYSGMVPITMVRDF